MDTANLPKTRAEAKATGAKYYFTGEPCKHGHVAPRKTKGACVECLKIEWKKDYTKRTEYFAEYNRSEAGKAAKERYYEKNKDYIIARALTTPTALKNQYRKTWAEKNTLSIRANTKNRRRKHKAATPPWLTRSQKTEMRSLYQIAIMMSRSTGEAYVVDHIYPLRSDVVCGLHVPWNLRVVTRAENLSKSNTLPSDEEALAFFPKKCYNVPSPRPHPSPLTDSADKSSRTAGAY